MDHDVIATDHAPHSVEEKSTSFDKAPFGIIGLETALGLALSLVSEGVLSLTEIIAKISFNPAAVLNLKKGTLSAGADGDITIIDPAKEWIVDAACFKSKAKNSPFLVEMKGRAVATLVGGIHNEI